MSKLASVHSLWVTIGVHLRMQTLLTVLKHTQQCYLDGLIKYLSCQDDSIDVHCVFMEPHGLFYLSQRHVHKVFSQLLSILMLDLVQLLNQMEFRLGGCPRIRGHRIILILNFVHCSCQLVSLLCHLAVIWESEVNLGNLDILMGIFVLGCNQDLLRKDWVEFIVSSLLEKVWSHRDYVVFRCDWVHVQTYISISKELVLEL
jgi:hypothetical protein